MFANSTIDLGHENVNGLNLVPKPPTKINAFILFFFLFIFIFYKYNILDYIKNNIIKDIFYNLYYKNVIK